MRSYIMNIGNTLFSLLVFCQDGIRNSYVYYILEITKPDKTRMSSSIYMDYIDWYRGSKINLVSNHTSLEKGILLATDPLNEFRTKNKFGK